MKKRYLLAIALAACLSAAAFTACEKGTSEEGGTGGTESPDQSYTYTVTFNSNGGSAVASVDVANNGQIDLDDYGTAADGMYFYGWYLDEALTQRAPTQFTPTGDVTLYAAWGTREQYTLTFDSCGGSEVAAQAYYAGDYLSAPEDPTRADHIFAGWYREADYAHEFIFAGNTMPAQDLTVYAKWTPLYTLTFEMNGGDPVEAVTGVAGTPVAQPVEPEREGYIFDGWYADAALTTPYTFGVLPEADVTVYAKWHEARDVSATLNINFGALTETQTVTLQEGAVIAGLDAEEIFETAVNGASEYDYLFDGWTLDAAGELPAETVPAQESLVLYAQWRLAAKYCTVTFVDGEEVLPLIVEKTNGLSEAQKASVSAFYGEDVTAFVSEGGTAYTLDSTFVSNVRLTPAEGEETFTFARSNFARGYLLTQYTGTETDVTVPAVYNGLPVVGIGEGAFADNTALTSVALPDSVLSVGAGAFAGCTALGSVTGGRYVAEIDLGAFEGCTALEYTAEEGALYLNGTCGVLLGVTADAGTTVGGVLTFTVPARTTAIAAGALQGNSRLQAVRFADGCSVTALPASAFAGCPALRSVDCTAIALTQVGESAFAGCTALTGVQLPDSATVIGASAFEGCTSLEALNVSATVIGARAFAGSGLVSVDWNALRITAVPEGAFAGCTALTGITLPETLTAIEASAFEGCTSLEKVTINASAGARIRSVGDRAFYGCSELRTVILFAQMTGGEPAAIAEDAFAGCADDLVIFVADGAPVYDRTSEWYLEDEDRMFTFEEVYRARYAYDFRTAEAVLPSVNVGAGSFLVAADEALASADVLELLVGFGVTASDDSTPSEEISLTVAEVVRLTAGTDAAGSPAAQETPLEAVEGRYDLSEAGRYRVQVRAEDRFGNYSFDFVEIIVFD